MGADGSPTAAQVRFVQVSPGAPEMDFYVNGMGAAYGLGYESFTSYLPVSPGGASLSANRAGSGQVLANLQGTINGGHQYTVILGHGLNAVQEHVYEDQVTPAPAGQTAIRVLSEITGAGTVNVYITPAGASTPATSFSVAAGSGSSYGNLPTTTTYTVTAAITEGGLSLPVANVTVRGGSGAVRTVVFAGVVSPVAHSGVVGFSLDDVDSP